MKYETIQCTAALENLAPLTEFVEGCAENFGLDTKKKFGLLVAVEEAFVNICSYAYPDGAVTGKDVTVFCGADGNAFVMEISDRGTPFDVLSLPDPDTTLTIMDREVGGLGVYFIRRLTDDVSYRREDGQNILRMVLRQTEDDAPQSTTMAAYPTT
jgi:anti-sigma regulatory factor (Ser/Thr protein kinase)